MGPKHLSCAGHVTRVEISDEPVACPVCGGPLGPEVLSSFDRLFALGGEYRVHECNSCRLGVTIPRLAGDALTQFYPPDYPSWQAARGTLIARMKRARARAMVVAPPYGSFMRRGHGRLLDVGCGRGDQAAAFAHAGWHARGLDISRDAVQAARAAGVEAEVGTLETAPWPSESFDLLILSHVLEHMPDPADALRRAHALLVPGGCLIVAVPNWDSWQRRLFRSRWSHLDTPRHLQHFTPDALHMLARKAGFRRGRTRRSVSAVALPVTLQYVLFGRWRLHGSAREAFLAAAVALYPLAWMVSRPLGGDSLYLVAEA